MWKHCLPPHKSRSQIIRTITSSSLLPASGAPVHIKVTPGWGRVKVTTTHTGYLPERQGMTRGSRGQDLQKFLLEHIRGEFLKRLWSKWENYRWCQILRNLPLCRNVELAIVTCGFETAWKGQFCVLVPVGGVLWKQCLKCYATKHVGHIYHIDCYLFHLAPYIFCNEDSVFWARRHNQSQRGIQRSLGCINEHRSIYLRASRWEYISEHSGACFRQCEHCQKPKEVACVKLYKYWRIKPIGPKSENCKHRCLVTGTLTSDSDSTIHLHKGHSNLAQKTLLHGCLPQNCLLNLGLTPPLLLILFTKGKCFKTTSVSLPFCLKSPCLFVSLIMSIVYYGT